jgi:hypothetical protein
LFFHSFLVVRLWVATGSRFADKASQKINISIMIDTNEIMEPKDETVFQDENASG